MRNIAKLLEMRLVGSSAIKFINVYFFIDARYHEDPIEAQINDQSTHPEPNLQDDKIARDVKIIFSMLECQYHCTRSQALQYGRLSFI